MYYCNECDIAYEGRDCPLCEALKEIEQLNKEIERLNNLE
jgi:rubrerythrin